MINVSDIERMIGVEVCQLYRLDDDDRTARRRAAGYSIRSWYREHALTEMTMLDRYRGRRESTGETGPGVRVGTA